MIFGRKCFIFDDGPAGEFESLFWPRRGGTYRYMPLRGKPHYRMRLCLQEKGSARCYYVRAGKRTFFTVVGFPKYGCLQLVNFETEDGNGKP
jgi:hypothetical protein